MPVIVSQIFLVVYNSHEQDQCCQECIILCTLCCVCIIMCTSLLLTVALVPHSWCLAFVPFALFIYLALLYFLRLISSVFCTAQLCLKFHHAVLWNLSSLTTSFRPIIKPYIVHVYSALCLILMQWCCHSLLTAS